MKHTKPSHPKPPSNIRSSDATRTGPVKPARRITATASLWLEFFMAYSTSLVGESESRSSDNELVDRAATLANLALAAYEERWPGVEP